MRRAVIVSGLVIAAVLTPAAVASAHPLGNFTVNHYDGLVLTPTRLIDHAVVDAAEIPTAQQRSSVDRNHDGMVDAAEAQSHASTTCAAVATSIVATAAGKPLSFVVTSSSFGYRPGAAGLQTSRLECSLSAGLVVTDRTDFTFADRFDSDRIGWREVTAAADGVHVQDSPVPQRSTSDELRHYPNDLLSSPLDVRSVALSVLPGSGRSTTQGVAKVPVAGPVARLVGRLDRALGGLAGERHLTLGVGALAVLVSLLLGAAHAALPGHGKTVMAAYLAGKRGTRRDAFVVGATVTVTHTAGVLVLGLALSLSSSLAGERVTSELGVVSGALIVLVGIALLTSVVRQRRTQAAHDHAHEHGHDHSHEREHRHGRGALIGMGVAGGLVPSPSALVVLLGAVALGRTVFGVVLVLTYGIGMAATLTAAGLLLVTAAERWRGKHLFGSLGARASRAMPAMTAVLVTVVGMGLAARSLVTL